MIEHPPPEPKTEVEIIEPVDRGGRPDHVVTEAFKNVVTVLAGIKMSERDIAAVLKIAPNTMKKYYRLQLDTGRAMLFADIAGAIMGKVREGDTRAMLYVSEKLGVFNVQERIESDGEGTPDKIIIEIVDNRPKIEGPKNG